MRPKYTPQLGSAVAVLILSGTGAMAAAHKSPRECNSELYSRIGAIEAAGETASQFVHECWQHARPGQPTRIAHRDPAASSPTTEAPKDTIVHRASPRRVAEAERTQQSRRRVARGISPSHPRSASAGAENSIRFREPRLEGRDVAWSKPSHRFVPERPTARTLRTARDDSRPQRSTESGDVQFALASLGPTAREGERMRVQIVAAGGARVQSAVAVGALYGDPMRTSALNCWGQPVLFVSRARIRWSRSMVCDGRPAGVNEWAAQIYYRGSEVVQAR